MNILVLNWQDRSHPQAGGAEVHLHEIFSRIVGLGHTVTLHCCEVPGAPYEANDDGIRILRSGRRAVFNWTVRAWWRKHGRLLKPDIVVDDINKIPFFAPKFVDVPVVGIVHHLFGDSIYNEVGRLAGSYVRYFERQIPKVYSRTPIAVVSESTRTECIELGLPAANLHVIHNALNHSQFPLAIGPKEATPVVTYFGRLKRYKSVDHVLRAFAEVKRRLPESRLWIVGDGNATTDLKALAAQLGIDNDTTFWGRVNDNEKVRLLSRSHVVVNPSRKEGWGITVLEANACGTPVVAANVAGLRDAVRDTETGLLYAYGDIAELTSMITRVLVNHDIRTALSKNAIQWASTFTWNRSAREMLDLLERTTESAP